MKPSRKQPNPGVLRFGALIAMIGLPLLLLGAYGVVRGRLTLNWPRADAVILAARVDLREGERRVRQGNLPDRIERTETASFHALFRYQVGGREYEADGVEPYDFGMQNSAGSRAQGRVYSPGDRVQVAYDPENPAVAYLVPGASSFARLLAGIGGGMLLVGLWIRHLGRQGIGRMQDDPPAG